MYRTRMYGTALCFAAALMACGLTPADLDTGSDPLPRATDESVPPSLASTMPATVTSAVATTTSVAAPPVAPTTIVTTTAVPVPLGGAGTTTTAAPTVSSPPVGSTATSDSFEGDALAPYWSVRRPDAVSMSVTGGSLVVDLESVAGWADDIDGFLLHQLVSGDMAVTATVRVRRTSDPATAPDRSPHLGGVMLRDPASDDALEDHVFVAVGVVDGTAVEWSSTDDGTSTTGRLGHPDSSAELRLCRRGSTVSMQSRSVGSATWSLAHARSRPDLPNELQAGVIVHAVDAPDLRVSVAEVTFASADEAGCP